MRAIRYVLIGVLALAICGPAALWAQDAGASTSAITGRTATSARSGNWSDPNTWAGHRVPGPTTTVAIESTDAVVLDSDAIVAGAVIDGDLAFDPDRSIQLLSYRNVIVNGTLEMKPASADQVHRLRFVAVDDSKFVGGGMVPLASDVGLWVMGAGRLDLEGAPKTAWLNLAAGLAAGQTTGIGLAAAPLGWRPGDDVFITPTQPPTAAVGKANYLGFDTSTVTSVDGSTLAIATPAARPHPMVDDRWTAEIGNLSRNVKIEGTATGYSHVFIHSTQPQTIRFVELTYMGDDKVIGRYPLHFHHDGDGSAGSIVDGVVVHESANHAFVPHASNGIAFTDTIAFDIAHTAYWWDPDTKISKGNGSSGVMFDHTIAADVHTHTGVRLAGFRLGGGLDHSNTIRNSVAVGIQGGNQASGFQWVSGSANWNFEDNLADNDKDLGILVWQNGGDQDVDGFTEYYSKTGILHGAYKNEFHYGAVTLYGNHDTGLTLYATARANGIIFDQLDIDGAGITQLGIFSCCHRSEGTTYPTTISNCAVANTTYGSVWMGTGRRAPNTVDLVNCSLGEKPFYFQTGTPVAGAVVVTNANEQFRLTPTAAGAGAGSTFNTAWNAWVSPLS